MNSGEMAAREAYVTKVNSPCDVQKSRIAKIKRTGSKSLVVVAVCPHCRVSYGAVWCGGRMLLRKLGKRLADCRVS